MKKKTPYFLFFLSIYISAQQHSLLKIDSLNEKARQHYYYEKDSAYYYFDQILETAQKLNNDSIYTESLFNSTGVASYHYDLVRMGDNLSELDSLIPRVNTFDSENHNILLYLKGDYHLKLFEYAQSRECFENIVKNISKVQKINRTETLSSLESVAYSFLGKIYMFEGKYDEAKRLYEKNIRDIKNNQPNNLESLHLNYNLLAEILLKEKKYYKANSYWLKTYEYNKEKDNTNSVITNAFHIADNYGFQLQKDSALFYLSEAKSLFNNKSIFYPKYHLKKAVIHKNNWEYELALIEIDSAIHVINQNFEGQKNADLITAYNEKGLIHGLLYQQEEALLNFDLALKKSLEKSIKDPVAIKIYKNKVSILNMNNDATSFNNSIKAVDEATEFLDYLKPSFKSSTDKLILMEDAFPLFESGMKAAYNLYISSKNEHYINEAFRYAEKSKSVLLLEALLSSRATQFANVPKGILERENQLKSEITHIEKKLTSSRSGDVFLEDDLFNLQQEHRGLVVDIETNYPAYYNLKYNTEVLSLPEIQEKLTDNELFVSYFYGNSTLYSIAATKHEKHFKSMVLSPELEDSIIELHAMLSNPKSELGSLSNLSYGLYQKLLGPILNSYPQENIIIVPDGLLNYIPFGSLVTNKEQKRYLVQDRAISYANSANLWSQLNGKKQSGNKLLAFAPSFDSNTSDDVRSGVLGNLPHNKKEIGQILKSFRGNSFSGSQATLQNFTSNISDHSILHLATHAVFDDENPEYSYLAFTPKSGSEDLLFVKDLYNLTLNASLVTLSACESGIGELKRGEGFLSLARGFFYSGASSILSTLWKVNDNSSSELMGSFYENLADGNTKDQSLREAKLSFLEKNSDNGLSHPYYWSGYTVQGNTQALVQSSKWKWYLFGGIVLMLIFSKKRLLQLLK